MTLYILFDPSYSLDHLRVVSFSIKAKYILDTYFLDAHPTSKTILAFPQSPDTSKNFGQQAFFFS